VVENNVKLSAFQILPTVINFLFNDTISAKPNNKPQRQTTNNNFKMVPANKLISNTLISILNIMMAHENNSKKLITDIILEAKLNAKGIIAANPINTNQ